MNHRASVLVALALAAPLAAQVHPVPTQFVWALDAGPQTSPSPVLRVYTPTGAEVLAVSTLPGSGQARALDFDRNGNAWLCRGNQVHQLDTTGNATGLILSPPAGASQAQDVVETPQGELLVAWGASQAASAVTRYDAAGVQLSNFTDAMLDHPRRITTTSDVSSTLVYVANRNGQQILSFDYLAGTPALATVADLSTQNVGPIGLCYDAANDDLWITSDWGQANEIGCIDLTTNVYSVAINYPTASAPGMTAPAGLFYDRFRNLYIAGRDRNMGTPGVYIYRATDPSSAPTFLQSFPRTGTTPVNVVDVALQASMMATCSPTEFTGSGTRNILEMGAVNRVTFSSPETPNVPFAAALSFRWQTSTCGASIYRPGVITLGFGGSDPRGIPLLSDDFFWSSVAVVTPGPSPVPPATNPATMMPFNNDFTAFGVDISGFLGDLDGAGMEDAIIDLTGFTDPGNAGGTDGMELSLAWVTFDLTEPSNVGFVSEPLCLVLRNPDASPVVATPCP